MRSWYAPTRHVPKWSARGTQLLVELQAKRASSGSGRFGVGMKSFSLPVHPGHVLDPVVSSVCADEVRTSASGGGVSWLMRCQILPTCGAGRRGGLVVRGAHGRPRRSSADVVVDELLVHVMHGSAVLQQEPPVDSPSIAARRFNGRERWGVFRERNDDVAARRPGVGGKGRVAGQRVLRRAPRLLAGLPLGKWWVWPRVISPFGPRSSVEPLVRRHARPMGHIKRTAECRN